MIVVGVVVRLAQRLSRAARDEACAYKVVGGACLFCIGFVAVAFAVHWFVFHTRKMCVLFTV